jgi:hypothetical protein
MVEC